MPAGLVIFDCDGVLVDSEEISIRELTRAIAAIGGTLTAREVRETFMGRSLGAIAAGVDAHLGRPAPDGWIDRFLAARAAVFERELEPVPGAAEAVAGVRALGFEACIASQGKPSKMAQTLRVTGLDGTFPPERIFSATMVERGKPAPDLFLHAAATCGVAVEACVVVEDSVTGVTAARAAGMRTLAYAADGDGAAVAALGAEVFDDMRAVPALVAGAATPSARG